ncbi:MAG: hypothetical protein HQL49_00860 [Gammaproteobacteria bacterium]|nr:hypothetical protein [Gammaproteobacteria bacterium]
MKARLLGLIMTGVMIVNVNLVIAANETADDNIIVNGSSRLKFKKGPVCMCNHGLTERDILLAQGSKGNRPIKEVFSWSNSTENNQEVERRKNAK